MNIGGMSQTTNTALNSNNIGKSTGKSSSTNTGGSKSPTKKPTNGG